MKRQSEPVASAPSIDRDVGWNIVDNIIIARMFFENHFKSNKCKVGYLCANLKKKLLQ